MQIVCLITSKYCAYLLSQETYYLKEIRNSDIRIKKFLKEQVYELIEEGKHFF